MESNTLFSSKNTAWTWADQISTYRFWGLILFYIFTAISTEFIFYKFNFCILTDFRGYSFSEASTLTYIFSAPTIIFGFYLGWIAIHSKTYYWLIISAILEIIGLALFCFMDGKAYLYAGTIIMEISSWAIFLTIPAILSGGRGGMKMFILVFGILTILKMFSGIIGPLYYGLIIEIFQHSPLIFFIGLSVCIFIGIIFLLPVRQTMFSAEPPQRKAVSIRPKYFNSVGSAFLCLIPFYIYYWLYKVHGEATYYAPSSKLLSPLGAGFGAFFLPFIVPAMIVALVDQFNKAGHEAENYIPMRKWKLIFWAFICNPVCVGILQSRINMLSRTA